MATINTIEDILRVLREDGEARSAVRRELLTEDLLAMPDRFAEMLKTQNAILEEQKSLRQDTDSLLKTQNTILEEQRSLRKDTNTLLDTLASVVREVEALRSDLNVHTNDIGELKGIGLETKLYNRGPSQLATLLSVYDIERVRVAERDDNSRQFNANIREALQSGAITMPEYDRILRTDMIVRALRMGVPSPIYAAVEATYSVTRSDIAKVKETARILEKVFPGTDIYMVLYYMYMATFIEQEAAEQGIHLAEVRSLE